MNTLKDSLEKMISVIEIVLMLSLVFHNLVLLIVVVMLDITGIHSTIMLGMVKLMIMVTVMLTVATFSLKLTLILVIILNTLKMEDIVPDVLMILKLMDSNTT
jgi:hypothetical protein